MENHTAKHFVLQLGSLVSLYLSLGFLLSLLFSIINIVFPDAIDDYWTIESNHDMVRISIAMLVVFFPTYIFLTRTVNKIRRTEADGTYLSLTKWLVFLSLLAGGGVLLGDLVAVIMAFLEGEITQRFILKAFAVLVVVGAAFHYYILDTKGYWTKNEQKSIMFAIGATLVVLASIGYGFAHIETPAAVREQKLDAQQVTDLQQLQWRIQDYSLTNGKLPETLSELSDGTLPEAPEDRAAYKYAITDEGFELCATFAQESKQNEFYGSTSVMEKGLIKNPDNWQHGAGEVCFKRIVNKEGTESVLPPGQILKQ
jgi:glucan phosphoethanolaminetransferase (alkaline phosphatase superfamily)